MTTTKPVLTDRRTLDEVVNCLTEHIPIQTQGKCEQQNIFEILIRAATQRDSIENTTKVLKNVPTSNDIRYHIVCTYKNGKRHAHRRKFFVYAVYKVKLTLQLMHDDYRHYE
ncbi:MAG: hypothetical protein V7K92_04905 [Nostoc sp.]